MIFPERSFSVLVVRRSLRGRVSVDPPGVLPNQKNGPKYGPKSSLSETRIHSSPHGGAAEPSTTATNVLSGSWVVPSS
jgi:hypothetical protein